MSDRRIKIRITKDGKVDVDASVFKDCMEVADKLKNLLGNIEKIGAKEEIEPVAIEEKAKIIEK
ncbi:MAG: hypothetical protein HZA12_06460 [Nitrospirae bacterium]|nr:hypothetical protein [Nitrospirota bacterium]